MVLGKIVAVLVGCHFLKMMPLKIVCLPQSGIDVSQITLLSSGNDNLRVNEVVVHPTTICSDMIQVFNDLNILKFLLYFTVLDANGQKE